MFSLKKTATATLLALAMISTGALAKGSPQDVAKLGVKGTPLTPTGAERAGNKDGTIPAWDGGIAQPPAGYKVGDHHQDPFPDDKPLLTITPENYKQYAEKLNPGQMAMFEKYKDYKMLIYPTRRSAAFPARIYEMSMKNAATGELIDDGDGLANVAESFPFPILDADPAKAGYEAIWNHKLKYRGSALSRWDDTAVPTASGEYQLVRIKEELLGLYSKPGVTLKDLNNVLTYFYQEVISPPRLAGQVLLVHESLDAKKDPRQAWIYNPGQRRVRRAPNVAYDNPGTASDDQRTDDMFDMFNGAMDKFTWTLVGKKEMYVPYNSYKVHSDKVTDKDIVKRGHLNQDLLRYELHRVYVVEAKLKAGQRHINNRRTFYLDEDSWQILEIEHYDNQDKLWRYSEAPTVVYYEVPTVMSTLEVHYDLKSGRYIVLGLDNQEKMFDFSYQSTPQNFTPESLRQRGIQ